jgi:hypothetical protein
MPNVRGAGCPVEEIEIRLFALVLVASTKDSEVYGTIAVELLTKNPIAAKPAIFATGPVTRGLVRYVEESNVQSESGEVLMATPPKDVTLKSWRFGTAGYSTRGTEASVSGSSTAMVPAPALPMSTYWPLPSTFVGLERGNRVRTFELPRSTTVTTSASLPATHAR